MSIRHVLPPAMLRKILGKILGETLGLQRKDGDAERLCAGDQLPIIACQLESFLGCAQEFHRGQMQSVKGADGNWKRPKRPRQDCFAQRDQRHAIEKGPSLIAMGACKAASVNAIPNLIFK